MGGMRGGHAEQQEFADARRQVGFDLCQQAFGGIPVDAGEAGDGFPLLETFYDEQGLDELLGMGAGFARQGPDMRVLAQAAEAYAAHGDPCCNASKWAEPVRILP